MTCSEVMTPNPKCCYPTDTVVRAAQIMREEDVGPVPIIDSASRKLIGMVTDRDIAINVVAAGREPHAVEVQDVMSKDLITCRVDEAYSNAMECMARHQVRRVPVVYSDGTLAGIISQADVARHSSDSDVGQVVEEISDSEGADRPMITGSYSSEASGLLTGAACFTIGAAMMYLLDPDRGRARRARARDKAVRLYNDSAWFAGKVQRDISNRAAGTVAEVKHRMHQEEDVPESKLVARVRSKMGRLLSHPHAVQVSAMDGGRVILNGDILADEVTTLLSAVRSVPGVTEIDNRLHIHESAEGISSLQGSSERPSQRWEIMKENWSPGTRVLVGALGGILALYGLRSSSTAGKTAGTVGLGLMARGISNTSMANWMPFDSIRQVH